LLEPHEQERYELPQATTTAASLYDHCRRSIERGMRTGQHGLPLMGCGDWNDGMNRVGELGLGESVWVGWMQLVVLREFLPLARARGDNDTARVWTEHADRLRAALEKHAWDGQWYRRAYFDDGTPLGSAANDECQIDSLAQTWAVLAEADPARVRQGVQSVLERLVRRDDRLVLLFAPPFDRTALEPGYIKGYLPGIRENGGQYTHSAIWLILALARLGRGADAMAIYDLIHPIRHAQSASDVARYQVEPYVVAADVYGLPPHVGRGGWTWYTGSAAWLYRVTLEALLGIELHGDRLLIHPCVPPSWPGYELTIRRGRTSWKLTVKLEAASDGGCTPCQPAEIRLTEDGQSHEIVIRCGRC
jgi:cyclic beta-1,2-glucan synthetase